MLVYEPQHLTLPWREALDSRDLILTLHFFWPSVSYHF